MPAQPLLIVLASGGLVFGLLVVVFVMVTKFYRKVEQGKALIVNTTRRDPEVTFTGKVVLPIIHKAEIMDISVKTIEIDRRGKEGLICKDNIRADIKVSFYVRVNKTEQDVIRVAQVVGCQRASHESTLEELFSAKFSEALKTAGKDMAFETLYTARDEFRDKIIVLIGTELFGYTLDAAAIDFLEQTPLDMLDDKNILDAEGIRTITERTAQEAVRTNQARNDEIKQIKKQDVERVEAVLALERQQAEAEAKQQREVLSARAREEAETRKVQEEERLRAEGQKIKTDEELAVADQNRLREVQVAEKNRERIVAVETERVEKARALEQVERERETELRTIDKEKAVETERKEIANVIRERIAVEKTVAEQEEAIKTLRVVEDAERSKEAVVIKARGDAEKDLVRDVKAAEAAEEAAKFRAREEVTIADARFEAADREAKGKMRLAQAKQAESAADGLAAVQVKEADAVATEKLGIAEVRVKEAEAGAVEKMGTAEAIAAERKLLAEATGLREKAASMQQLDESGRGHEEYRLRIAKERELGLEAIEANVQVAEAQARVIAQGLKEAKIDIVGGESVFFDRLVGAIGMGKAVDGFIEKSDAATRVMSDYRRGSGNLREDILEVLTKSNVKASDVQHLTVSAFLSRLMSSGDADSREKIRRVLEEAERLGISDSALG